MSWEVFVDLEQLSWGAVHSLCLQFFVFPPPFERVSHLCALVQKHTVDHQKRNESPSSLHWTASCSSYFRRTYCKQALSSMPTLWIDSSPRLQTFGTVQLSQHTHCLNKACVIFTTIINITFELKSLFRTTFPFLLLQGHKIHHHPHFYRVKGVRQVQQNKPSCKLRWRNDFNRQIPFSVKLKEILSKEPWNSTRGHE